MSRLGLVAGCSHIGGCEIDGTLDSEFNRDKSFGSLLVKKMDYDPVNIAINGSSNSSIMRAILRWFDTQYKDDDDVFVCIGWTESSRMEVPALDIISDYHSGNPNIDWYDTSASNFYNVNYGYSGHTEYQKELYPRLHKFMYENEKFLEILSVQNILTIQYFLRSKNIPYVMCNTMKMTSDDNSYSSYLSDLIDRSRFYEFDNSDIKSFYWKYKNIGYSNPKAKYWHHGEEPHRLYSEELYNFIGEKNV